jgi:hypothetical protein
VKARCGRDKIILQKLKGASFALRPADHNIIMAGFGNVVHGKPCCLFQAAANAVSGDSVAQFLGAGETKSGWLFIIAPAQLHHEGGHGLGNRFGGGNKILPPLKPFHRCYGLLSRQALAALGATAAQNVASTYGCHAGAKAVTALADKLGWLVSALHDRNSVYFIGFCQAFENTRCFLKPMVAKPIFVG